MLSTSSPEVPLEEALILGNCKRFDVYLATSARVTGKRVRDHVAEAVSRQVVWHGARAVSWVEGVKSWMLQVVSGFDNEDVVAPLGELEPKSGQSNEEVESFARNLVKSLEVRSGAEAVATYCCSVAAGLEGRPVEAFNPCSARDAHIMLQLKRTLEAVLAPSVASSEAADGLPPPCRKRLGLVARAALEVGKAVRNPESLPEVRPIQHTGDGRAALRPPKAQAAAAARAAQERILRPAVAKCAADLEGLRNAAGVVRLRSRAEELLRRALAAGGPAGEAPPPAAAAAARKAANRLLHEPTLALKAGAMLDEDAVLSDVKAAIDERIAAG